MSTSKLDACAKQAFAARLVAEGHSQVQIIQAPADIRSVPPGAGDAHYWEVKGTDVATGIVFGAATATELEAALANPERYHFVIAQRLDDDDWCFRRLTPNEFLVFCTLPPAKIYFHFPLNGSTQRRRRRRAIQATPDRVQAVQSLFQTFRGAPSATWAQA